MKSGRSTTLFTVQTMSIIRSVRPAVQNMAGYAPGEQPKDGRPLVKLNTNENPFPPPPEVIEAVRAAVGESLRLYPEPSSRPVREAAARAYGLEPDQVIAGNGSDDLLTMILRTFVDQGERVAAPDPTYSLYETLTHLQGGHFKTVPWNEDGSLPIEELAAIGAKVTFVVRPNAPTGHAVPLEQVLELCGRLADAGVVVLDGAYADFADDSGLPLLTAAENLIVTRTFSKSFSLAGLRIGLGFMHRSIAAQMHKVRDSYNLDRLAQAAAVAALENLDAFHGPIKAIRAERARVTAALREKGFTVPDSQANFVLAQVPGGDGKKWLEALRGEAVLVRYFGNDPRLADKIRITIGTPEENDAFLAAVDRINA